MRTWASFLAIFAVIVAGCATNAANRVPAVTPAELQLRLHADRLEIPGTAPFSVEYRLTNLSKVAVCVSGSEERFVGGRKVEARVVVDQLCPPNALQVSPGETTTWQSTWPGVGCLKEAPPGFAKAFPDRMCGGKVSVRSQIQLFRLSGGVPQYGAVTVSSEALVFTLTEGS